MDLPLGVGMVQPYLVPGQALYFYGVPPRDGLPGEAAPVDSLTFLAGPYYTDVATAPPWFVPEVFKLDYNLLYLRAKTLTLHWIEVVVNTQTGETRWVDRHAVAFVDWPTFLLGAVSVEVIAPEANPIRSGPGEETALLDAKPDEPLQPQAVQGGWMKVGASIFADRAVPTGWIRWHGGERLVIDYALLS